MEHVEKIRLPKPPKALTDAAERGGNAILRASKKLPKVRLAKPRNPFAAGTSATLRRASQSAATMRAAAAGLAALPGVGWAGGALGGALGGPKGAAAGFAGGAAVDYAATAALGLMAGRRAKAAGYLSRRKERKDGVYKARKSLPIPWRNAPARWMDHEKTKQAILDRAERYDRFARAPGKRAAGGKARQEIARAEAARLRGLVRDGAAWSLFGRAGADAPAGFDGAPGRDKLEQDRAKAKAAASRRNDKNRDGWIDGQKPKGAKPRKTAEKPKPETTGDKLRRASQTKIKGDPQAEHAEASRAYQEALDAQQANQREGMQAAGRARRASEASKPRARDADGAASHRGALKGHAAESGRKARAAQAGPLASQAKVDAEVARTGEALRRASAKLDAMKEQRRLDSMPSAEQMRADNDKMMRRRLAELDAGIKAKKDAAQARRENDAALLRVHETNTMGRKRRRKVTVEPISKAYTFSFEKADVTGRYVRGWANVVEIDGEPVVDVQGDIIAMDEMRKSAHDFIANAREAKAMHDGDRIGDVVESVIIDDDFAKVHGVTHKKRGWWIGMEVHDPAVRKRVASGELRSFSIGGSGKRTEIGKRRAVARYMAKPRPAGLMGLVAERPNKPMARAVRNYNAQPKGPLGLIRGAIRRERDKGLAPKRRERARFGLKLKAGIMAGALIGAGMATPNVVMTHANNYHAAAMSQSAQMMREHNNRLRGQIADLRKRLRRA